MRHRERPLLSDFAFISIQFISIQSFHVDKTLNVDKAIVLCLQGCVWKNA